MTSSVFNNGDKTLLSCQILNPNSYGKSNVFKTIFQLRFAAITSCTRFKNVREPHGELGREDRDVILVFATHFLITWPFERRW